MNRWFTPRKLQHLRIPFHLDITIDRSLAFLKRQMLPARSARRVTHRAREIATRSDFQQTDASMLLVFRAQAAVERTSLVWLHAKVTWNLPRHVELCLIVPLDVGANEIVPRSMGLAAFAKVNTITPRNNLRRHDRQAFRTKTLRDPENGVVAKLIIHTALFNESRATSSKMQTTR